MSSFFRLRFPVARGKKEDTPLAESDIIRQIRPMECLLFFRLRFPVARGKKEDIPLAESDIIRQFRPME